MSDKMFHIPCLRWGSFRVQTEQLNY